jgi:hypothetical protein
LRLVTNGKASVTQCVAVDDGPCQGSVYTCFMKTIALLIGLLSLGIATSRADETEFKSLFNGTDLTGWDGDAKFWRVENGALVGQTTADNKAPHNTFLIYRGGEFGNFEMRYKFKCEGFNSGMQYRSIDKGDHVMSGMQADFEARCHPDKKDPSKPMADITSGMYFEELGRGFMGQRGEAVIVRANPEKPKKPNIEKIGTVGDFVELEKVIKRDDWNDYTIIANGNFSIHIINGHVMSIGIDEDEKNFRKSGLIGLQLHAGPPMRIDVKDVKIRELK